MSILRCKSVMIKLKAGRDNVTGQWTRAWNVCVCLRRGDRSGAVRAGRSVWRVKAGARWWKTICGVSSLCACASHAAPSWRRTCPGYSTSARSLTTSTPRSTCVTSSTSNPRKRSKVKVPPRSHPPKPRSGLLFVLFFFFFLAKLFYWNEVWFQFMRNEM